jgi:hypothetical protein
MMSGATLVIPLICLHGMYRKYITLSHLYFLHLLKGKVHPISCPEGTEEE